MSSLTIYDKTFYSEKTQESLESAELIVPLVLKILEPKSVVDAGCGMGAWLSVFKKGGATNILGLDGDYIDQAGLLIPPESFRPTDLSKPFELSNKFDLAISLEVAEHLPGKSAAMFIDSLCKLAPVILFSAAIPHQGGTHHVNEQWPEYWRQIFARHNYKMFDPFRSEIWHNQRIGYYYRQNLYLFVSSDLVQREPAFRDLVEIKDYNNLNTLMLVSAPILNSYVNVGLGDTLKKIPDLFRRAILRRLGQ
jgi:SAM-dependent methyltransferase